MAKKVYGLSKVEIAPIASDGGAGTSFTELGETVAGTANLTQEDNQETDFNIEESDSPIASITSTFGKLIANWSSYKINASMLQMVLGGTAVAYQAAGRIATLGSITGGTSYVNGTYTNVPLTGGAGSGATANITVSGGAVTAVTIVNAGSGYATSNALSASNTNLGGAGSGFSVPVSTIGALVEESWTAPDNFADLEKTLRLTDRNGNVLLAPRVKLSTKMSLSFAKDKLGQLDFKATILQPTKSGVARLTSTFAQ